GGRHDDGGRHPRALVRAERRKPHFLPGPWSGRRGRITGEDLRGPRRGADAALSGGSLVSPVFLQVAPYTFRWNVLVRYLPAFARALLITFEVSIVAELVGIALGLIAALARLSRWRFLRAVAIGYIDF